MGKQQLLPGFIPAGTTKQKTVPHVIGGKVVRFRKKSRYFQRAVYKEPQAEEGITESGVVLRDGVPSR